MNKCTDCKYWKRLTYNKGKCQNKQSIYFTNITFEFDKCLSFYKNPCGWKISSNCVNIITMNYDKERIQKIKYNCKHFEHSFPYGWARCKYHELLFQATTLVSEEGYVDLKPSCKDCNYYER